MSKPMSMTAQQRHVAIQRAGELTELLHSEYRCFEALWRKHGTYAHKKAFDEALSNHHKAMELRDSLIEGMKE